MTTYAPVYADAYGLAEDEAAFGQASREWKTFWLLIVPQILIACAALAVGVPGVVLLLVCVPVLVACLVNPFIGVAALFAILVFDDMLAVVESIFSLSKAIGIFVLLGFLFRGKHSGYSLFPIEPVSIAAFAFVTLMMLSAAWSPFALKALTGALPTMLLAGLVIIGSQVIDRRHRIEIVLAALFLSGASAAALLDFGIVGFAEESGGGQERTSLGGANSNLTGRILVVATVAGVTLLMNSRRRLLKWLVPFGAFLMFVAILKTKSRGALVELGSALFLCTVVGMRARMGQKLAVVIVATVTSVGSVTVAGATGLIPLDTIFSRWEGGLEGLTRSRSKIHEVGLDLWTESVRNLVVGAGHATFALSYTEQAGRAQDFRAGLGRDAHNQWVKTLGELGAAGFVMLASLVTALVFVAYRTAPGYAMISWGAVGMLAVASMSASLDTQKISWYSLILVAAAARITPKARAAAREDPILAEYDRLRATTW